MYIYMSGILSRISCPMCRQQVGLILSLETFIIIKNGLITGKRENQKGLYFKRSLTL
jgi:hypothetical protein